MTDKPAQRPSYPLRMPDELRAKLEEEAKHIGRSLHAEIVARLEQSLDGPLGSLSWLDAVDFLRREAQKRGASIQIIVGAEINESPQSGVKFSRTPPKNMQQK